MQDVILKATQATVVMICHTILGGVTVTGMWAVQHLIEYFGGGRGVLIYGRWPLEYLFQPPM